MLSHPLDLPPAEADLCLLSDAALLSLSLPDAAGQLSLRSNLSGWYRYWFALHGSQLLYFERAQGTRRGLLVGTISLFRSAISVSHSLKRRREFEITDLAARIHVLRADSDDELHWWIHLFSNARNKIPPAHPIAPPPAATSSSSNANSNTNSAATAGTSAAPAVATASAGVAKKTPTQAQLPHSLPQLARAQQQQPLQQPLTATNSNSTSEVPANSTNQISALSTLSSSSSSSSSTASSPSANLQQPHLPNLPPLSPSSVNATSVSSAAPVPIIPTPPPPPPSIPVPNTAVDTHLRVDHVLCVVHGIGVDFQTLERNVRQLQAGYHEIMAKVFPDIDFGLELVVSYWRPALTDLDVHGLLQALVPRAPGEAVSHSNSTSQQSQTQQQRNPPLRPQRQQQQKQQEPATTSSASSQQQRPIVESNPLKELMEHRVIDYIYYTHPRYRHHMLRAVCKQINDGIAAFRARRPEFRGKISVMGHSLGSALCFDLLSRRVSGDRALLAAEGLWLDFDVDTLFTLGSPLGTLLALDPTIGGGHVDISSSSSISTSAAPASGDNKELPFRIVNVFKYDDPIATRLEPLRDLRWADVPPVTVPCWVNMGVRESTAQWFGSLWAGQRRDDQSIAINDKGVTGKGSVAGKNGTAKAFGSEGPGGGRETDIAGEADVTDGTSGAPLSDGNRGRRRQGRRRMDSISDDVNNGYNNGNGTLDERREMRLDFALQVSSTFEEMSTSWSAIRAHSEYWGNRDTMLLLVSRMMKSTFEIDDDCSKGGGVGDPLTREIQRRIVDKDILSKAEEGDSADEAIWRQEKLGARRRSYGYNGDTDSRADRHGSGGKKEKGREKRAADGSNNRTRLTRSKTMRKKRRDANGVGGDDSDNDEDILLAPSGDIGHGEMKEGDGLKKRRERVRYGSGGDAGGVTAEKRQSGRAGSRGSSRHLSNSNSNSSSGSSSSRSSSGQSGSNSHSGSDDLEDAVKDVVDRVIGGAVGMHELMREHPGVRVRDSGGIGVRSPAASTSKASGEGASSGWASYLSGSWFGSSTATGRS